MPIPLRLNAVLGRFTRMNRKSRLLLVIAICVAATICIWVGWRLSHRNGTIYYEAKSAAAVNALRSRIEPLRVVLRDNTNFKEVTCERTLVFVGTTNGSFADCYIGFDRDEHDGAKDDSAVLVVTTPRTSSGTKQLRSLRQVIEQALSPDVLKQLNVSFDTGWDMK